MKNLPCYIMAISALLFACSSSSDNAGAGGTSSKGGKTSTSTSSGGSSTSTASGGTTSSASGGTTSTLTPDTSGLDASMVNTALTDADAATLCQWVELVMGLVPGATTDTPYVSGTFYSNQCATGAAVQLWGSPMLCNTNIKGNAVGCSTLTIANFETCIKTVKSDLCLLETASACNDFNSCFPLLVED